jgi:hypothetical protein
MAKARASIFAEEGEGGELDLGAFAPKTSLDTKAPRPEQVRAVAQAAKFHSREPTVVEPGVKAKRAGRQYRTGRNVQFNVKVSQETLEAFYAIADAQTWVLGYTVQRAIEALQRELKNPA